MDEVLRGVDAVAAYISILADQHRALITEELKEQVENDAISFCPDLRTDPLRQISYLDITTTFINNRFEFRSHDLCRAPFEEENKSAESIVIVSMLLFPHANYFYFLGPTKRTKKIWYCRFIDVKICE